MSSGPEETRTPTALEAALDMLARADHSTVELRVKLAKKGYDDGSVQAALSRLVEMGYLNDESYACQWVLRRQRTRPSGSHLLRHELEQKGLDPGAIDRVLSQVVTEESETSMALQVARKWVRQRFGPDQLLVTAKDGAKLARHLYSRGFDREVIETIVDRAISSGLGEQRPD